MGYGWISDSHNVVLFRVVSEDIDAAIALGLIDERDMIITKDTSELKYVRDDLSVQTIRPRNLMFNTVSEANKALNNSEDSYAGQTVMIKDNKGKYAPWVVQQSASTGRFLVEPFIVSQTNFQWTEF